MFAFVVNLSSSVVFIGVYMYIISLLSKFNPRPTVTKVPAPRQKKNYPVPDPPPFPGSQQISKIWPRDTIFLFFFFKLFFGCTVQSGYPPWSRAPRSPLILIHTICGHLSSTHLYRSSPLEVSHKFWNIHTKDGMFCTITSENGFPF